MRIVFEKDRRIPPNLNDEEFDKAYRKLVYGLRNEEIEAYADRIAQLDNRLRATDVNVAFAFFKDLLLKNREEERRKTTILPSPTRLIYLES